MYRNPETLTTFFSSGTKHLLNFLSLVFRHEERETQFLLCWPFPLTQQMRGASRRPQTEFASSRFKSQLASPSFGPQLTAFFQNHQESQPIASGHDATHTPVPFSICFFFLSWHLWLSHPPRTSVNTCAQCVYLHVH